MLRFMGFGSIYIRKSPLYAITITIWPTQSDGASTLAITPKSNKRSYSFLKRLRVVYRYLLLVGKIRGLISLLILSVTVPGNLPNPPSKALI